MISQEEILNLVKSKGPVLPAEIAKSIGSDILMASARLSELVDNKKLAISNIKVGSSPVYYCSGQEYKLQNFVENLNEKDKRAFDLIKERKILKDNELEPLMRVAIRAIKDFAAPLQVTYNNEKIVFWKWYLLDKNKTEELIKKMLQTEQEKKRLEEENKKKQLEEKNKQIEKEKQLNEEKIFLEQERAKQEDEKKRIEEEKNKQIELEKQKIESERRIKEEKLNKELEEKNRLIEQEKNKLEKEKKILEDKNKELERKNEISEKKNTKKQEEQKELKQAATDEQIINDKFFSELKRYLDEKKINIIKYSIIKKEKEIDMIIEIPSAVGRLNYYCKAKNKQRVADSDLSAAFVQGQLKKMPVLFLIKGELTKKAEELLKSEFNKGLVIKKFM